MANTIRPYTGDGTTVLYPVDFDLGYIRKAYIYVYLEGNDYTEQLDYTYINDVQIQLTTPVASGTVFNIRRVVPRDAIVNDYEDGAAMQEENLDDSFKQAVMALQEIQDGFTNPDGAFGINGLLDMLGNRIVNVGTAVEPGDAINKETLDYFLLTNPDLVDLVAQAVEAAASAEEDALAAGVAIDQFREDYAGHGATFPTPTPDDGVLFYYDGTSFTQGLYITYMSNANQYTGTWDLVSGVGPQGPTGPQGVQGSEGIKGDQGLVGPTGIQGQQGLQGALGATGPTGVKGETGSQGPQGPQGIVGPTGDVGPQGIVGPDGPVGITGPQGNEGPIGSQGDTGTQGPTGPTGPAGIQGVQGIIGPDGSTGAQGIQGTKGDQGSVGATGDQGPLGPTGPTGAQGLIGVQGVQGLVGPQGELGIPGATGPTGPQGVQGPTGVQGPEGQSFTIDEVGLYADRGTFDNELSGFSYYATDFSVTATMTPNQDRAVGDGSTTSYLLTYVPDGPQSLAVEVGGVLQGVDTYVVNIVESPESYTVVFNEAPLNGLKIIIREFSLATGYGALFFKESNASGDWGDAIPFGKGPRGDQGAVGPTGSQGPQGPTGPTGAQGPVGGTGIQGDQGITGTQGPQGDQGSDGVQGPQGTVGIQGIAGVQGDQGDTGPQGTQGDQGIIGATGPQGATGDVGPIGSAGATGPQGAKGVTGSQGATGIQGSVGPAGPVGAQGSVGLTGPQGFQGDIGPQGQQGPTGDRGPVGIQGAEGATGTTGSQGPQGNAGATGPQGAQGPVGDQGARGDQGGVGPTGSDGADGRSSSGKVFLQPVVSLPDSSGTSVNLQNIQVVNSQVFDRVIRVSGLFHTTIFSTTSPANSIRIFGVFHGGTTYSGATLVDYDGGTAFQEVPPLYITIPAGATGTLYLYAQRTATNTSDEDRISGGGFAGGSATEQFLVELYPKSTELQ